MQTNLNVDKKIYTIYRSLKTMHSIQTFYRNIQATSYIKLLEIGAISILLSLSNARLALHFSLDSLVLPPSYMYADASTRMHFIVSFVLNTLALWPNRFFLMNLFALEIDASSLL